MYLAAGEKKKRAELAMSSTVPMRWRGMERTAAAATSCSRGHGHGSESDGKGKGVGRRTNLGDEASDAFRSFDRTGSDDLQRQVRDGSVACRVDKENEGGREGEKRTFALTPLGPNSTAITLNSASTPAFAAETCAW